eukprot:TRINITY_DN25920_c0_g2_i1.p1 TRINITY_DN25920_c0_g2~~TRINITY_DN25920_c0_g2_i1.p1  ORF type:complete len:1026 (+),score=209.83 TRINITY_DN25920_c0_g2_i1:87-3080(+)
MEELDENEEFIALWPAPAAALLHLQSSTGALCDFVRHARIEDEADAQCFADTMRALSVVVAEVDRALRKVLEHEETEGDALAPAGCARADNPRTRADAPEEPTSPAAELVVKARPAVLGNPGRELRDRAETVFLHKYLHPAGLEGNPPRPKPEPSDAGDKDRAGDQTSDLDRGVVAAVSLITEALAFSVRAERGAVYLSAPSLGDDLRRVACVGPHPAHSASSVPKGQGVPGVVTASGLGLNAVSADSSTKCIADLSAISVLAMPLKGISKPLTGPERTGALLLMNKCDGAAFTEEDEGAVATVCELLHFIVNRYDCDYIRLAETVARCFAEAKMHYARLTSPSPARWQAPAEAQPAWKGAQQLRSVRHTLHRMVLTAPRQHWNCDEGWTQAASSARLAHRLSSASSTIRWMEDAWYQQARAAADSLNDKSDQRGLVTELQQRLCEMAATEKRLRSDLQQARGQETLLQRLEKATAAVRAKTASHGSVVEEERRPAKSKRSDRWSSRQPSGRVSPDRLPSPHARRRGESQTPASPTVLSPSSPPAHTPSNIADVHSVLSGLSVEGAGGDGVQTGSGVVFVLPEPPAQPERHLRPSSGDPGFAAAPRLSVTDAALESDGDRSVRSDSQAATARRASVLSTRSSARRWSNLNLEVPAQGQRGRRKSTSFGFNMSAQRKSNDVHAGVAAYVARRFQEAVQEKSKGRFRGIASARIPRKPSEVTASLSLQLDAVSETASRFHAEAQKQALYGPPSPDAAQTKRASPRSPTNASPANRSPRSRSARPPTPPRSNARPPRPIPSPLPSCASTSADAPSLGHTAPVTPLKSPRPSTSLEAPCRASAPTLPSAPERSVQQLPHPAPPALSAVPQPLPSPWASELGSETSCAAGSPSPEPGADEMRQAWQNPRPPGPRVQRRRPRKTSVRRPTKFMAAGGVAGSTWAHAARSSLTVGVATIQLPRPTITSACSTPTPGMSQPRSSSGGSAASEQPKRAPSRPGDGK